MARTTIHSLAYKVLVDTDDFEKGVSASRKEINAAKRTFREVLTPAEKYEIELNKIDKQLKKGIIDQDIYNRKLNKMEKELKGVNVQAGKSAGIFKKLGGSMTTFLAGFGVQQGLGFLKNNITERAKELKDFERFGLTASESFGTFRAMAASAGVEVERLVDATKDLTIRIGEAKFDGQGEMFDQFQKLGLNIDELFAKKPEQQLRAFAEAIRQVENETERLAITDILLSDAGTDVLKVIEQGDKGFAAAAQSAKQLGLNIDNISATALQESSKSVKEMELSLKQFSDTFVNELAPELTPVLKDLTGALKALQPVIGPLGKLYGLSIKATVPGGFTTDRQKAGNKLAMQQLTAGVGVGFAQFGIATGGSGKQGAAPRTRGTRGGNYQRRYHRSDFSGGKRSGASSGMDPATRLGAQIAQQQQQLKFGMDMFGKAFGGALNIGGRLGRAGAGMFPGSSMGVRQERQTNFESVQKGTAEAFKLVNATQVSHQQKVLMENQKTATNTETMVEILRQMLGRGAAGNGGNALER